jgi:hypothetical protein
MALHLDRLANFVGDGDLSRIEENMLTKYRGHLLKQPFSAWYAHAHLKTARTFLKWCWETRRIDELP